MIWILGILTCYRLCRLVTTDQITKRFRLWVDDRTRFGFYLVTCDWCLSIWIAPFIAAPIVLWPGSDLLLFVLAWFSLSAVTGLISVIEQRLDL